MQTKNGKTEKSSIDQGNYRNKVAKYDSSGKPLGM
jgi:hypothetical protein